MIEVDHIKLKDKPLLMIPLCKIGMYSVHCKTRIIYTNTR